MREARILLALFTIGTLLPMVHGCDAAIRGTQTVLITVTDAQSHRPLKDVYVQCAPATWGPAPEEATPGSMEGYVERSATAEGTTGDDGRVALRVAVTSAYGSVYHSMFRFLRTPSVPRDEVSGRAFAFLLTCGGNRELLTVKMDKGGKVAGTVFEFIVEEISAPQGVESRR